MDRNLRLQLLDHVKKTGALLLQLYNGLPPASPISMIFLALHNVPGIKTCTAKAARKTHQTLLSALTLGSGSQCKDSRDSKRLDSALVASTRQRRNAQPAAPTSFPIRIDLACVWSVDASVTL